jgi:hypothetical protein
MRRVVRSLTGLLAVALALIAVAWWLARPASPDEFYRPASAPSPAPGVLLRQEEFVRRVPAGADAWRILYTTTRADGTPAVASAIVMASREPRSEPRPVIAWTHGTTGVVPGCAPSLLADPFANVPALRELIDEGWVFVGTDYVGQGTDGPHPYLIGEGEARSSLDAIRAVRGIEGVRIGRGIVAWGHSQGGHAALWTGIVAPTYAPDVDILGVAAIAPASDLPSLLDAIHDTPVGRIMSAYVLRSYAEAYPDVQPDAYVPAWKRWLAEDMAGRCLAAPDALFSVAQASLAGASLFAVEPTTGPLGKRLAENTPTSPLRQPLLIAQGLTDELVLPDIQAGFVRKRCEAGENLEYRTYAGRDHLSVVAPDSPLTRDLVQWTRDRFGGVTPATNCPP